MKRLLVCAALLVLVALCAYASTTTFVYGSSISSIDMDQDVRVGQVYLDSSSNVLIVKSVLRDVDYGGQENGTVVEFDKYISRGEHVFGSPLVRRGPIIGIGVYGGLRHSLARVSVTCALYPLYPVVMAGLGYDLEGAKAIDSLVLGGFGVQFPIARLWDSDFTLIENGKIGAWCAFGLSISDSVTFAGSYGFSYRHNVGPFSWELGGMWLYRSGGKNLISPYIGLGVDI